MNSPPGFRRPIKLDMRSLTHQIIRVRNDKGLFYRQLVLKLLLFQVDLVFL